MEVDEKAPAGGPMIHFGPADNHGVHLPHNDVLVISATAANYTAHYIFIGSCSSMDVQFYKVYQQTEFGDVMLEPMDRSLYGFTGEVVHPGIDPTSPLLGVRAHPGDWNGCFLIMDMSSAYNLILGRPVLNTFQALFLHITLS
ncbi:UNVERIFIED_CONTAM: hypothetical protein Sradi_4465100 [Sesamum radiatum]|uniref:Uncharacterized protein n=1 Tax=Sesamum radiatum TaxID=300843 RepID=A0AAW2NST0_SESRA